MQDPLTLLIVDDDPFQRKILRAWLEPSGWRIKEAEDVEQALEHIPYARLALVDLRLAEEDGFEVARRMAALSLESPPTLVAMSAEMSESVRARCREAGFAHTMAKPFQRDNVLDAVRGLSASARNLAGHGGSAAGADVPREVPAALRDVPALAALWRLEQTSSEPELVPAVEGLRQAGRMLTSAAGDAGAQAGRAVAAAAHGLVGAAGILGCTRVEVTSKALASKVREQGLDGETRLLITVIENEVETAVEDLLAKIERATDPRTSRHAPSR